MLTNLIITALGQSTYSGSTRLLLAEENSKDSARRLLNCLKLEIFRDTAFLRQYSMVCGSNFYRICVCMCIVHSVMIHNKSLRDRPVLSTSHDVRAIIYRRALAFYEYFNPNMHLSHYLSSLSLGSYRWQSIALLRLKQRILWIL